jgi:hypothetical protein
MLSEGIYKLSRDVKNPHPDKRKTREWTAEPVLKAGRQFIVRRDYRYVRVVLCVGARNDRHWGLHSVTVDDPEYADLVAALIPAEDNSLEGIKDCFDVGERGLLHEMLDRGLITEKALAVIASEMHARNVAQWEKAVEKDRTEIFAHTK